MRDVMVVAAEIGHVYALASRLREADRAEIEAVGADPRQTLRRCFRSGVMVKTAFVEGEIAAMWGLGGTLVSSIGIPWLLTTPAVERVPLAMARIGKAHVDAMLRLRPVLSNFVAADYTRAIGFLKLLGFQIHDPVPFGPKRVPFCRFERRREGVEWALIHSQ